MTAIAFCPILLLSSPPPLPPSPSVRPLPQMTVLMDTIDALHQPAPPAAPLTLAGEAAPAGTDSGTLPAATTAPSVGVTSPKAPATAGESAPTVGGVLAADGSTLPAPSPLAARLAELSARVCMLEALRGEHERALAEVRLLSASLPPLLSAVRRQRRVGIAGAAYAFAHITSAGVGGAASSRWSRPFFLRPLLPTSLSLLPLQAHGSCRRPGHVTPAGRARSHYHPACPRRR